MVVSGKVQVPENIKYVTKSVFVISNTESLQTP